MPPARIAASDLASLLPADANVYVQGCSAESLVLADAVEGAGAVLGAMTASGIFVPGVNRRKWRPNDKSATQTFFLTPELSSGPVRFLPLCYADIRALLERTRFDAALFMVSPPDRDGMCSFGSTVDFLPLLWRDIPVRIAHVNPSMPPTSGHRGIPFAELTGYLEQDAPLLGRAAENSDALSARIAEHVEAHIPDGATLQTGLGRTPDAVLRALAHKRELRLHTGLIGDGVLDLLAAGALARDVPILAGVAIGSPELYAAIKSDAFAFQPVSVTHDPGTIARIANFVAINSAFEVDLFGQAYAEMGLKGFSSGPGGASDFARAAKAADGLRIVVLPSAARNASRIVAPGRGRGPVSLSRMDTDLVVTEHGAADLRGRDHDGRAKALIAIADPDHRETLSRSWAEFARGS